MELEKQFLKYVSQNVMGMIGISCYILADTFFISVSSGADGITVLNLALPIYGLIFAIGAMLGIGSATRYAILKAQQNKDADNYLFSGIIWICIVSIPFVLVGLISPESLLRIMGGDNEIVAIGREYFRLFVTFAPAFMLNNLFQAFVRNDGDPTRAMCATVAGSIFNIIFDYIFMFPMKMGLTGAALATSISPIIGIVISATHFLTNRNTLKIKVKPPSVKRLFHSCQLGVSAFVAEISSAVITTVFNFLLLGLVGKIAVAAYGVIANLALVSVAIFNGISQGMQPLISEYYGGGKVLEVKKLLKMGFITAAISSILIIVAAYAFTDSFIAVFNSEGSKELAYYAHHGLRIYFLGYVFAGFNIVATGYLSSVARAKEAFVASVLRGFIAILACAIVLSSLFGIAGVWMSFPLAEGISSLIIIVFMVKYRV